MRLLLVEDDHPLAKAMIDMLRQGNDTIDWVDDGQHALEALARENFDLVILDLTLPRLDGLEVLRRIRGDGIRTPVIILTARAELTEKLLGLDSGADDFLTKPFVMAELRARIRAVIRRAEGQVDHTLRVGQLTLDPEQGQLRTGSGCVQLPRSEAQLLQYLMRHPDQVATRRRLEEQLYGWDQGVESNALEVHIHHLRRRIGKAAIRTVRGVGYLLDSQAVAQPEADPCP